MLSKKLSSAFLGMVMIESYKLMQIKSKKRGVVIITQF